MCERIINELFNPINDTNVDTSIYMPDISASICRTFLKELRDPKKTIFTHLSSMNGDLCWDKATEESITHSMNVSVVNDACESTFGVMTEEINVYKNIGLTHAGGVAMAKKMEILILVSRKYPKMVSNVLIM